jgi:hypothetical protein
MMEAGIVAMTIAELMQEAEHLTRPCAYLRTTGERHCATWVGSPGAAFELLFSSGCVPQPGWPRDGRFRLRSERITATLTFEDGLSVAEEASGLPLYATRALSLPPIDAIFMRGSERIQDWLRSLNWRAEWGFNANFPDAGVADEYARRYQQQLPFFTGGAHAVLGGWHFPWPEGDWHDRISSRLLVWTFERGEPWLEGWDEGGTLRALQRIT